MSDNKFKHNPKNGKSAIKKAAVSIAAGMIVGIIIFMITALLISFILYRQNISSDTYGIFISIPAALSGFFGGYTSSGIMKSNGLIIGFISALPVFFAIAAIALFLSKEPVNISGWTVLGVMCVCSAGAGVISVNKKSKKKKTKKLKNKR